ncbi:MAG: 4Fe-4S binding protein [Isosphaeraceae bacterium]|nr:4Fe-4S binding protein [Isosphaeraceae bacterium]
MARNINPPVTLEPRDSDVLMPEDLFVKLPPFSRLKRVPSLHKFPGSLRLRRFRKGDVICRQGDAGWTAFAIPTAQDLVEYRDAAERELPKAEDELKKAEEKRADLAKKREEAGDDPKQAASLGEKLEEAEAAVADCRDRIARYQAALPYLKRAIVPSRSVEETEPAVEAGREAGRRLEARRQQATADGDTRAASLYRELIDAAPAQKRARAESVLGTDPELAGWLRSIARADELRQVALVQLALPQARGRDEGGLLAGIKGLFGGREPKARPTPAFIPIDGPRNLDYGDPVAALYEGELFGEMSCRYRSPRSASVIATRDGYLLEMLRNVLDAMLKDENFKNEQDTIYRDRVLESQLREIPVMTLLDDRLLERVRQNAELVDYDSGELIYDEHDDADGMHLIRSGIIQVMTNASYLLSAEGITRWGDLEAELAAARDPSAGPAHALWRLLPGETAPKDGASENARPEVVARLNSLLKTPGLMERAGLQGLVREQRVGRKVWKVLAAPARGSEVDMERCQRLLIDALYTKFPAWIPLETGERPSYLFRVEAVADWKTFASTLLEGSTKEDPRRRVWELLPATVQGSLREAVGSAAERTAGAKRPGAAKASATAAVAEAKEGRELSATERAALVEALNAIIVSQPLLLDPAFQDFARSKKGAEIVMQFMPNGETWSKHDFDRYTRAFNRFLLDAVFPLGIGTATRPVGPALTLAYRARGEFVGEMGLLAGRPRRASCVAFGHIEDDPEREVGTVQLVRISRALFEELKRESPAFAKHLAAEAEKRLAEEGQLRTRASVARIAPQASAGRAEELGLIQGQKLMLIDLDRCTRCDECVRACVQSHDDGRSRLYLDGPRFDKFLVPATCRSCLDPVCMIGCPVGSIHRGKNNEIVIEDWCIGCEACANQCPYGSIQMHTVGVIPMSAFGWRFVPVSAAAADWFQPVRSDRSWPLTRTPFVYDRDFREDVTRLSQAPANEQGTIEPVCFRYPFDVPARVLGPGHYFVLVLLTLDDSPKLWLNGRPLIPAQATATGEIAVAKADCRRKDRVQRPLKGYEYEVRFPAGLLRRSANVVAVQITPKQGECVQLLDLFLDHEESATVKLVEQKAVVCDLCSALPGQDPACVKACPHDAALRINARVELSTL